MLSLLRRSISAGLCRDSLRGLASPAAKVVGAKEDKGSIDADAHKICTHVCINHYIQGEEPGPKIKEDSEYPPWLFQLNVDPPLPLEDMQADSWLYWRELRKRQIEQNRRIQKLKLRFLHLQK